VPRRAHTQTKPATRRCGASPHQLLDPVPLPLLAQHHSTAEPSAKRYGNHYKGRFLSRTAQNPPKIHLKMQVSDVCSLLLLSVVLCLDILMNSEADFIKEISYLAALMRQNCHDASWRMEQLLSRVEQGESLDTRSTSIQLREAREELQQVMRGIEGIQKLCELESDES
jgi:hypothetical protein